MKVTGIGQQNRRNNNDRTECNSYCPSSNWLHCHRHRCSSCSSSHVQITPIFVYSVRPRPPEARRLVSPPTGESLDSIPYMQTSACRLLRTSTRILHLRNHLRSAPLSVRNIMSSSTLPSSMKAIQIQQQGGLEVIEMRDLPVPQPKAGEVLIKVEYSG